MSSSSLPSRIPHRKANRSASSASGAASSGFSSSGSGSSRRPHKKKGHHGGGSSGAGPGPGPGTASSGSGSGNRRRPITPEQGDYIINWHLQYCADRFLQTETILHALEDQIKAELMKIKTDGEFIKNQLSGPHEHLARLKNQDRDLRAILDSINNLSDLFRTISQRSANRLI